MISNRIMAWTCYTQSREREWTERGTLPVYRMELGIEMLSFISLYALPNLVCFGAQIRAVFSGTGKSQCLKIPSLVIDSVVTGLAWGGRLPSHSHLNFRLGQCASTENDDLRGTYYFPFWNCTLMLFLCFV